MHWLSFYLGGCAMTAGVGIGWFRACVRMDPSRIYGTPLVSCLLMVALWPVAALWAPFAIPEKTKEGK